MFKDELLKTMELRLEWLVEIALTAEEVGDCHMAEITKAKAKELQLWINTLHNITL